MQAVAVVVLAFAAVAAAGGITGYSTGNYVQHAHALHAVAAGPAFVGGPAGVYAAPAIGKAVSPVAHSSAFVNRAPAARVLAAPAIAAAPVAAYGPAIAAPAAYAAPAYGAPLLG